MIQEASQAPPESPTTARPLDFDDEPTEAGADNVPANSKTEEAAPPKPPRPLSPREQATTTLKEAFPSIDASVINAVLAASGGQVESAFNALLGQYRFLCPEYHALITRRHDRSRCC